jgi:hypothetical protein
MAWSWRWVIWLKATTGERFPVGGNVIRARRGKAAGDNVFGRDSRGSGALTKWANLTAFCAAELLTSVQNTYSILTLPE